LFLCEKSIKTARLYQRPARASELLIISEIKQEQEMVRTQRCFTEAQFTTLAIRLHAGLLGVDDNCTLNRHLCGRRGHAVPYFRTRCEYVRVRSVATSMSLTFLK